jgi:erythromycin esterase-like protein
VKQQKNTNTVKLTSSHVRLFGEWLKSINEQREIQFIEFSTLDKYLAQSFLSVRTNGNDKQDINSAERQYEPTTLEAIHSSIDI